MWTQFLPKGNIRKYIINKYIDIAETRNTEQRESAVPNADSRAKGMRAMSRYEGAPDLIGADGRPIERGDTVRELGRRRPIIVTFVDYIERKASGFCAETGARVYNLKPENLTHEAQPDSIGALAGDLVELAERAEGSVLYREIAALAARARHLAGPDVEHDYVEAWANEIRKALGVVE